MRPIKVFIKNKSIKKNGFLLLSEFTAFFILGLIIISIYLCLIALNITYYQKVSINESKIEFEKIVLYFKNNELNDILGEYDYEVIDDSIVLRLKNNDKSMNKTNKFTIIITKNTGDVNNEGYKINNSYNFTLYRENRVIESIVVDL